MVPDVQGLDVGHAISYTVHNSFVVSAFFFDSWQEHSEYAPRPVQEDDLPVSDELGDTLIKIDSR